MGVTDVVLPGMVGVTVNPERRLGLVDECFEVGSVGGAEDIVFVLGGDGAIAWCVVGHHNGFAGVGFGEGLLEPVARLFVDGCCIERSQFGVAGAAANAAEVVHGLGGFYACKARVAEEGEVGPEGAAEEVVAIDGDGVVFEDVDVGVLGLVFEFFDKSGVGAAVVFVVAEDVDDGFVGDVVNGPFEAA